MTVKGLFGCHFGSLSVRVSGVVWVFGLGFVGGVGVFVVVVGSQGGLVLDYYSNTSVRMACVGLAVGLSGYTSWSPRVGGEPAYINFLLWECVWLL